MNKKNILGKFSSFFKPRRCNYFQLEWVNLHRKALYRNDFVSKRPVTVESTFHTQRYALLTKREVNMAGYWPSSSLRFYWPERRKRLTYSHIDRRSLVNKGFIVWLTRNLFLAGPNAGYPERERWAHLTRAGSQSERRIYFISPARGFSNIIIPGLADPELHTRLSLIWRIWVSSWVRSWRREMEKRNDLSFPSTPQSVSQEYTCWLYKGRSPLRVIKNLSPTAAWAIL